MRRGFIRVIAAAPGWSRLGRERIAAERSAQWYCRVGPWEINPPLGKGSGSVSALSGPDLFVLVTRAWDALLSIAGPGGPSAHDDDATREIFSVLSRARASDFPRLLGSSALGRLGCRRAKQHADANLKMLGDRDQHLKAGSAGAVLDFLQVGRFASDGFSELRLSHPVRLSQARNVGPNDGQERFGIGVEGHALCVRLVVFPLKHSVRMRS
jgi:hypothetical protein